MSKFIHLLLFMALAQFLASCDSKSTKSSTQPSLAQIQKAINALPRVFVPNQGQWDDEALFATQGFYGATWITREGELRHVLLYREKCEKTQDKPTLKIQGTIETLPDPQSCPINAWVISEKFLNAKISKVKPEDATPTKVSYLIGSDQSEHKKDLKTYRYVNYGEIYKGIELKLSATQKSVEKIFRVSPNADPRRIRMEVIGATEISVSERGELYVNTEYGQVVFSKPKAWQELDGKRVEVEVYYEVDPRNNTYGFVVGEYDRNRELWIDPVLQSTYLGGLGIDKAEAIAIGSDGSVYVAGYTYSTNFPKTAGGVQARPVSLRDAFVSKLSSDLQTILQSTYIGGVDGDEAYALAIGSDGSVYVAGFTFSNDFPKTTNGAQARHGGGIDAFVSRLSNDLRTILHSTYLGGSARDDANFLVIGSDGSVYVAGITTSRDFPITAGSVQVKFGGGLQDAFISRLSGDLRTIYQSTYLGGSENEEIDALSIGLDGSVYAAGWTNSTNFPVTAGSFQTKYGGGSHDGFVSKISSDLKTLYHSTYLGGSAYDDAGPLVIHSDGSIYIAGDTKSTNFPKTTGGAQTSHSGKSDVYILRLSGDLRTIHQSTYLGGSGEDFVTGLAVGSDSSVYVLGWTDSKNFPKTANGAQANYGGSHDVFVSKLSSDLRILHQSTYLGGSGDDFADKLAIGLDGSIYVVGDTESIDFPQTSGGAQARIGGERDVFVSKLTADLLAGYRLTIKIYGTGQGNVSKNPEKQLYTHGSQVTLTATPQASSLFEGWTGDCDSCGKNQTCTIVINSDKTCIATFTRSK